METTIKVYPVEGFMFIATEDEIEESAVGITHVNKSLVSTIRTLYPWSALKKVVVEIPHEYNN